MGRKEIMITDKLLEAITNNDWSIVISVWETLSGQQYKVQLLETLQNQKKPKVKAKSTKKAVDVKSTKNSGFSLTKAEENKSSNTRINLFDSMPISIDKDLGYDKINDKINPTPRRRKPFTPKNVKCSSCGKEESVSPILARENYRCNRCGAKGA